MKMISLKAQARTSEKNAKVLRRENIVPGVLYGNEAVNTSVQCDYSEIYKAYATGGGSTIVELDLDGKKIPSLFHAVSFDPVSDKIIHVDFYAVNLKKEIEAQIPLEFIGESAAVKDLSGVLVTTHDHVTVTCLPTNLPALIEVDLGALKTFEDALLVSDIVVPEGVVIADDLDMMIATVQEPRKEVEETPVEEGASAEGDKEQEGDDKEKAQEDAEKSA